MASNKSRPRGEVSDAVDKARVAVDRAIVRLIGLTVSEEPDLAEKADRALQDLGPSVIVGPMLAILMGKSSETLKIETLRTLEAFSPEFDQQIALGVCPSIRSQNSQAYTTKEFVAIEPS